MCQRLPNGNTLIVNPGIDARGGDDGRGFVLEVTPAKELVWRCFCAVQVPTARRYGPEQVNFIKGGTRPRP